MPTVYPDSVPVLGNIKVQALVTMASRTAPTVATLTHTTAVDLSCALTADGWKPTTTQSKSNKMRRLCSKADTERLNPAQHTISTLMWSQGDPQNPEPDFANLLVEGALLYLVERHGLDAEDAFTAGDIVRSHYVRLGAVYPMFDATADNGEFLMACEVEYVDNGPVDGIAAA